MNAPAIRETVPLAELGDLDPKTIRKHATRWLWIYNSERPNMAIGGITPAMKLKKAV